MNKTAALFLLCAAFSGAIAAQDFGFGFDDESGGTAAALPVSVTIGGEIGAAFLGYVHDFGDTDKLKETSLGDMVSGRLNFSASGANVDAVIDLKLSAATLGNLSDGSSVYSPLVLDEAYLRAFFGPVSVEAGLCKLTWGKADSLGPLDVVNPLDYSDLTNITDIMAIKIARPMLHLSWNMGGFSKLETVFIPNFAGHRFASSGRWTPAQFERYRTGIVDRIVSQYEGILSSLLSSLPAVGIPADNIKDILTNSLSGNSTYLPDTGGFEYFQTGLRYTTTIDSPTTTSADIGAQYFYGNLFRPGMAPQSDVDVFINNFVSGLVSNPLSIADVSLGSLVSYNRYHQFGIDYAQVLFGYNIRGEFAVHYTEDFIGNKGTVRNPFIGWSLGFDRDVLWGISVNIQCNESIRLLNNKVNRDPALDSEAGTNASATRVTSRLSKKFLKDNLECRASVIWDIEEKGWYIIPAVVWSIRDITAEFSAGVFAGDASGELGQYWNNSFIKAGLKYSF